MCTNLQWHDAPKELPATPAVCLTYCGGRYCVYVWNSYYKCWDDEMEGYTQFDANEELKWAILEIFEE